MRKKEREERNDKYQYNISQRLPGGIEEAA